MQSLLIDRELERLFFERVSDIELLGKKIELRTKAREPISFIHEDILQTKNSYKMYDDVYLLSPGKIIVAGTKNIINAQKVPSVLIAKSESVPLTIFGYSSEGNAISFVKTLRDTQNKMIGTLIANVPISYIHDLLNQFSNSRYNYLEHIELKTGNGQVIYSQNKKEPYRFFGPPEYESIDLTKAGFHDNEEQMWVTTHSLETGIGNIDQKWILIVRAHKDEVYQEARTQAIILFIGISIVIILFSIFSYQLFGFIARPIEKASKAVLEAGEGHFESINALKITNDEFGDLVRSLQTMNHRIVGLLDDLNKSLKETRHQLDLRNEFISIVAHELRTPLTPVSFQIQFLKRLMQKEKFKGHQYEKELKNIYEISLKQLRELNDLIDSLLDFSRISLGQFTYSFQLDTDLVLLLKKNIDRYRESFKVEIEEKLPESLKGHWDPTKIEIVINNLLSNAIHYGEGRKIEVEAYLYDPNTARFTVKDHGIGIRPEDLERIFLKFERGVSFKNYGGIGLGLFLSRRIVEDHHGKIWVTSVPGVGTTFYVELPLNR